MKTTKNKKRNKAVIMAMMGSIIGIVYSIIFSNSQNILAIVPVAATVGGVIGAVIDYKKNKYQESKIE